MCHIVYTLLEMSEHGLFITSLVYLDDRPQSLVDVEAAGRTCDDAAWRGRTAWVDIASGLRPLDLENAEWTRGEWKHGWQFHSGRDLEQGAYASLDQSLALPSIQSNAVALCKQGCNLAGGLLHPTS